MADETEFPSIVVHEVPRTKYTPSLSPYPIKLETFLRMAKVPYESDFKNPMSKKGKTPWMTVDGVDVADTYFCIEYLKKNYDIDVNKHLSEEEKAIAISFRTLVEDHLYWALVHWRADKEYYSVLKTHFPTNAFFRNFMLPVFRRKMSKQAHAQGMGRHNWEETVQLIQEDLLALSTFLGSKKYLMGDQPSEVDCTVFGMMCQLIFNIVEPLPLPILDQDPLKNLKEYTMRVKEEFWPDWDQCCYGAESPREPPAEAKENDEESEKEKEDEDVKEKNKEDDNEKKEEEEKGEKKEEEKEKQPETDSKDEPSN